MGLPRAGTKDHHKQERRCGNAKSVLYESSRPPSLVVVEPLADRRHKESGPIGRNEGQSNESDLLMA